MNGAIDTRCRVRLTKLAGNPGDERYDVFKGHKDGYWIEGDSRIPMKGYVAMLYPITNCENFLTRAKSLNWFVTPNIQKIVDMDWGKLIFTTNDLWKWEEIPSTPILLR
jgi:hypothetical protein